MVLSVSNRQVKIWRNGPWWGCSFESFEGRDFDMWANGSTLKSALRSLRRKLCARGVDEWMDKHTQQDRRDMLTAMIEQMA